METDSSDCHHVQRILFSLSELCDSSIYCGELVLHSMLLLPMLMAVAGGGVRFLPQVVCVSVFLHDISKMMQLGSPNLA